MADVLDRETYAKVLQAEPMVVVVSEILAKLIVKHLDLETKNSDPEYAVVIKPSSAWSMSVKDMTWLITKTEAVGDEVTAARVGRTVTKLGLRSFRTREGFKFFWNEKQLALLKTALGL